jgi:UDP-galactopyranose mutase
MPYDYLIVGAGLFGATFAHEATGRGLKCLVIDRRPHTGGNVYCENIEGINVHKYGAHIFHTSDPETWKFVNDIVPFNRFTNSPLALAPDGRLYNLPFNMNTFYQLWGERDPKAVERIIEQQRREALDRMHADGVTEPRNLEEQALTLVGKDVYRLLIKEYTEKQWGRKCTELPAFIIRRLPLRFTFDNNYFNDAFQGIPVGGYNPLIEGLLKGSDVVLDTDFFADRDRWQRVARRMLFTGKIDEFYGFRFGKLDYRTVRFETEVLDTPNYQGNAVINHTSASVPYTRVIEHKHFETFGDRVYDNPRTVVSREYSTEWTEGMEPFYPVNDARNQAIYEQYRALAGLEPDVLFGGRLAEYRYYDMAPLIARARQLFKTAEKE